MREVSNKKSFIPLLSALLLILSIMVGCLVGCDGQQDSGKMELKMRSTHCTMNNETILELSYDLNNYASVTISADEGYVLPNDIRVYSGNEIIMPGNYTYALSENKKIANFVIKMEKTFDASIVAVEDIEVVYVGEHKISETGDYSYINPRGAYNSVYYSKETNELTLRDAVISEDIFGSMEFTNSEDVNVSYLITYTGTKPLTINLFGENHFVFDAASSSDNKGVIISRNSGDINLVGPGYNYVDGAGQGFIYSDSNVNVRDCFINCSNAGLWGIASRFLNIVDSTIGIYQGSGESQESYYKAIDAVDCSITRSVIDINGFMNGIYATNLKVFSAKIDIKSVIGINADWIYGYGERPINNNFTTYLNVIGKIAGIRSFDLQEWQYCVLNVSCEQGTALSAKESTIRLYNSKVKAVITSTIDCIESFRMVISGSEVYAENKADNGYAIRCLTLPQAETSADKQAFIRIENSHITAKGKAAAISGHGTLEVNGTESFADANKHYLSKKVDGTQYLTVWGIFPLSTTDFEYELDSRAQTPSSAHPLGCVTDLVLDARTTK